MSVIVEYIKSQPYDQQAKLFQIHETIQAVIPESVEKIAYGMPTYWQGENIIHFAQAKNHIGIYPTPDAIIHFQKEIDAYRFKSSKGAIKIPNDATVPLELISKIVMWRVINRTIDR